MKDTRLKIFFFGYRYLAAKLLLFLLNILAELFSVKKSLYDRAAESLQEIIDSSKLSAPEGQDAAVLPTLLKAYTDYKHSYAKNIRFDADFTNLSK